MGIDTSISFDSVALTELEFKLNKNFKRPKDGIPVKADISIKKTFSPNKKTLYLILTLSLFEKAKNKPFEMKVSVQGIFSGKNYKDLEQFSKVNASAHLFPFVREIIGNTTLKANIPPLLLPPFNLSSVLSKGKKR